MPPCPLCTAYSRRSTARTSRHFPRSSPTTSSTERLPGPTAARAGRLRPDPGLSSSRVLNVSYETKEIICTEDRIVVRAVGNGIAVAAVHGPAVAGRPYRMDTMHVYRTEGDRLAEHWGVRDELGALIQLGVLPAPQLDLYAGVMP